MFGRRELQVRMVKAPKADTVSEDNTPIKNWNDIADVAAKFTRDGAIVIGGVYIATRAFNTFCNIAEHVARVKIK